MLTLLIIAVIVLGLAFILVQARPELLAFAEGQDQPILIGVAVLLGLYALWMLVSSGSKIRESVASLLVWLAIALAAVAGYAYRTEVELVASRIAGELLPPGHVVSERPGENGEQAVRLRRRPDGHFAARAEVNGSNTILMVDTGASTVVLRPLDAQRAGIDTDNLAFTIPVQTANGTAFAAATRIRSIKIGDIELRDVEALVAKPGTLDESLLGMSFLTRLRSYEFSGEFLTLRS
jgi:aspartyl protease family protein